MKLDENGITHLGGKGLVGFMILHQVKDFDVIEVDVLKDEGLAHGVIGSIVEVFRSKSGSVDLRITRISLRDDGLLH